MILFVVGVFKKNGVVVVLIIKQFYGLFYYYNGFNVDKFFYIKVFVFVVIVGVFDVIEWYFWGSNFKVVYEYYFGIEILGGQFVG